MEKVINNIPHITQILKIEPYKITSLLDTGEVRVNDFEEDFNVPNYLDIFYLLSDYEVFKYASVSEEGTLQWVNLPMKISILGKEIESPFIESAGGSWTYEDRGGKTLWSQTNTILFKND